MPEKCSEISDSQKLVLHYHYAGITNTGRVRDHNEDAYMLPTEVEGRTLSKTGYLYVLADGMGGHQKGEIASAITIETVNSEYYAAVSTINEASSIEKMAEALASAIATANVEVLDATQGGGTTVVATVLHMDSLVSMNVGDSRAYLLRDNELRLISKDHSLVSRLVEMGKITEEDALTHPRRNVLYQALGQGSDVDIYTWHQKVQLNDIIILCSDGLWGEIGDPAMVQILNNAANPLAAAEQLIDLANMSGGPDNITAIIIEVSDKEAPVSGYGSEIQSPQPIADLDDTQPSMPAPLYSKPDTLPENDG